MIGVAYAVLKQLQVQNEIENISKSNMNLKGNAYDILCSYLICDHLHGVFRSQVCLSIYANLSACRDLCTRSFVCSIVICVFLITSLAASS